MEKKYKLTDETIEVDGHILHRIIALTDFGDVKEGDKGGWIESEVNLSQKWDCWISGEAKVYDNAQVFDNAIVHGLAQVHDYAKVYDNATVWREAQIYGHAQVYDFADVSGGSDVCGFSHVLDKQK